MKHLVFLIVVSDMDPGAQRDFPGILFYQSVDDF
jgi:hypothetical protein